MKKVATTSFDLLKQKILDHSLSCISTTFQSNIAHGKGICICLCTSTKPSNLFMRCLEISYDFMLLSLYRRSMDAMGENEKLLQGKEQSPQATKREVASFSYRHSMKKIEQHETWAHNSFIICG
jgi:hypothetical protein